MGAKTWMLVYTDGDPIDILRASPELNRDETRRFAEHLFSKHDLVPGGDGDLLYTNPPDEEVFVGCFPGLTVVAAAEVGIDYPSKLDSSFLDAGNGRTLYLFAMHSVVDWFAFAIWERGKLKRALSLSPDSGILEDHGAHLDFESPYWDGEHSLDPEDGYALPFHPLEFGEDALLALLGFQYEGYVDKWSVQPESVPLVRFKRR